MFATILLSMALTGQSPMDRIHQDRARLNYIHQRNQVLPTALGAYGYGYSPSIYTNRFNQQWLGPYPYGNGPFGWGTPFAYGQWGYNTAWRP